MSGQRSKLLLSLLAVIAVAVMIFIFSAQAGEDSSRLSNGLTKWVLTRVVPGFEDMPSGEQAALLKRVGFIVRKIAHFSEYALLALTLVVFLRNYRPDWQPKSMAFCAWGIATLYACTDELHQMFVDARGPSLRDVCIDSAGAVFGTLFSITLAMIILRLKKRTSER